MEDLFLHPPEAAKREPTQFFESNLTDEENLRAEEISLDAELNSSAFAISETTNLPISISEFLRDRHLYLIARTGSGKSTMLERVVVSDINDRKPGLFLDPHGESAYRVLDTIKRTRKVCYFDLSSKTHAVRYNPIAGIPLHEAAKAASDHIAAVRDIFFQRDFNAPRFTHYYRNHLIPLIERGRGTLRDLLRMLSDKDFRDGIVSNIKDPLAQDFWREKTGEYAQADKKYNREAVAPIANKLSQILSAPNVRNILDCRSPVLRLDKAFRDGYFVVVNLAKGQIGNDAAAFIGSLLLSDANNVLMAREPNEVVATPLTLDEFQNYAPFLLADMLAEIRKKGGQISMAHQFSSQLEEETFDAIMGNCGTIISFQVSPKDARLLAPQFDVRAHQQFAPSALTSLEPYHAIMRTTDIERIVTMPPAPATGRAEVVIRASNARFARRLR